MVCEQHNPACAQEAKKPGEAQFYRSTPSALLWSKAFFTSANQALTSQTGQHGTEDMSRWCDIAGGLWTVGGAKNMIDSDE